MRSTKVVIGTIQVPWKRKVDALNPSDRILDAQIKIEIVRLHGCLFRVIKMPSKMTAEDMNNNPLGKVDGETNSSALGDEGLQCGEECNLSVPSKAA